MLSNVPITLIRKKINEVVLWKELRYALLSLLPVFISFLIFKEVLFLKVGLITMSLFISAMRLKSSISLINLHYCLILAGFSLLYFSINNTIIFAILCALMAFGSIFITKFGSKLRTLANYTFIPSVYLACEIQHSFPSNHWPNIYWVFIALSPVAWITILTLQWYFKLFQSTNNSSLKASTLKLERKWLRNVEKGEPYDEWLQPGLAIFIGVFVSACFASFLHLDSAEWLIWSTASVVTTDFLSAKAKFRHRALGVLLGISIGIIIGQFLPKNEVVFSLAVLGIMLTLVSFKNYFFSFSSRCFFIALAASSTSSTQHIAFTRVENIISGGLIGLFSIYLIFFLFRHKSIKINHE